MMAALIVLSYFKHWTTLEAGEQRTLLAAQRNTCLAGAGVGYKLFTEILYSTFFVLNPK